MIFLWLTHPTKPHRRFWHLEREICESVWIRFYPSTLHCTVHDASPLLPQRSNPKASHQKDLVPSSARPLEVPGSDGRATKEQNASFALSSQQHCRILPPALDVTNYSNWCGDLKELRRVLPPPSSPFVWGSLAAPRHLQNLQHSFNSPSPSLNTTSSAFFLPPKF